MDDETRLYVEDAIEHLDEADRAALRIDHDLHAGRPPADDALNAVFRCVHTLKGNAGVMGFASTVALAHALEWGLDRVRAGELALDVELVNHLFAGLDALRTLTGALAAGEEASFDVAPVVLEIERRFAGGAPASTVPAPASLEARLPAAPAGCASLAERFPGWALAPAREHPALVQRLDAGEQVLHLVWLAGGDPHPGAAQDLDQVCALGTFVAWRPLGEGPDAEGVYVTSAPFDVLARFLPASVRSCEPWGSPAAEAAARPQLALEAAEAVPAAPAPAAVRAPAAEPGPLPPDPTEASIRVGRDLLDKLMNLVGELVLTRNQVLQHLRGTDDQALMAPVQRLNLITTELQEAVMRTRMQPVGQLWEKFPRLVRDYGQSSGKRIQLVQEGAETELDKSLLEAIKDPLTHLVRNAIDHGLEAPAAREAAGKPATATLTLVAYQDGGQIIIEVRDDGRGLDYAKIREKARSMGLVAPDALARLGEAELAQLIFHPGFSTAAAVTSISGRGVGMDVVRANIERIGGQVDLRSITGVGTTFRLRIPLTLAVIPALIIMSGSERFALPQSAVLEVVRTGGALQRIEQVQDSLVYRLRETLIPVVRLRTVLGMPVEATELDEVQLVVVQSGGRVFGLAVDGIGDTEEIVVKPLHRFLQALDVYSGVTIMGDGRSCMILDMGGTATRGGLASAAEETADAVVSRSDQAGGPTQRLLLVRVGARTYALPMALVSRLEEFQPERLERIGDRTVVQYGQGLLPVIQPEPALGLAVQRSEGPAHVVVLGAGEGLVGLRVGGIVDIVEENLVTHAVAGVPGVRGAVVIGGAATEILDVAGLVDAGHARTLPPAEREALMASLKDLTQEVAK